MIYFLADAHLGSRLQTDPHGQERRLVSLLDSMKCDATAIYLLGDIFDFWFEYKTVVPKGFVRVLGKLAELSDAGIDIHYFIGNHDIWTFGYLEREIGLTVHRQPETLELAGRKCYLAHGDGLNDNSHGFGLLRRVFHNRFLQKLFRAVPPTLGMEFGLHWSASNRRKELLHDNGYKGENNENLVQFAKHREQLEHADYYIFGHRHIMLDLQLATGSRVVVLGDFIRHFSYAKLDENGHLTLEIWEESTSDK